MNFRINFKKRIPKEPKFQDRMKAKFFEMIKKGIIDFGGESTLSSYVKLKKGIPGNMGYQCVI